MVKFGDGTVVGSGGVVLQLSVAGGGGVSLQLRVAGGGGVTAGPHGPEGGVGGMPPTDIIFLLVLIFKSNWVYF